MSLPKIIEDIDTRIKDTGDTMTGSLTIQTANSKGLILHRINDEYRNGIEFTNSFGSNGRISTTKDGDSILFYQPVDGITDTNNGKLVLHSGNYTSYVPTLTGTGASGTWPISITGNATTLGGFSESSFLRDYGKVRGIDAGTDNFDTLWSQIGIKQYELSLPDNMEDGATYNYGATISLPSINARFDLWYNHQTSRNGDGLRYRTGWNTDKCEWLTLLDSKNYSKFSPTLTGGGASGTWGISISGNASTATKLATARNIALGGDLTGSANFDGSGNITINGYEYNCSVNSGNKANYPWHRIATIPALSNTYNDRECIIIIRHGYDGGGVGLAKISVRSNLNSNGTAKIIWLYRYNIQVDALQMGFINTAGKTQGDVYYKVGAWARCQVYQTQGGRSWTLITSSEVSDTTTSDKKGSYEVYTSIADGGSKLGKSYTHTIVAADNSHPINSGTSSMTANSSSLATSNVYLQYV